MDLQMTSASCVEAEETEMETSSYRVKALCRYRFGKDLKTNMEIKPVRRCYLMKFISAVFDPKGLKLGTSQAFCFMETGYMGQTFRMDIC